MNVFITGISGFIGGHLAEHALSRGATVTGTCSRAGTAAGAPPDVQVTACDIGDGAGLAALLDAARPDLVFHLAAATAGRGDGADPEAVFRTNVLGTYSLLGAVGRAAPEAMVLIPGSSAQFGLVPESEQPITEATPYRPTTHYAVSKIAQAMAGLEHFLARGLRVVRTHTFNCIGPRQGPGMVPAAFIEQIVAIERGAREPVLSVGNLRTRRDITDVRDVVRAYWLAAVGGVPGEVYNVCAGRATAIDELLNGLLRMSDADIEVREEAARLRPGDVPVQVGAPDRLRAATGWMPEIALERTLADMLVDWRARGPATDPN